MRQARKTVHNGRYHVCAKASRDEFIFNDEDMKELYLTIIDRARTKYPFELNSYVIMGNHVHLIIKPLGDSSISRIMQYIQDLFAMIFNKIHNLKGPVWQGRFWSTVLETIWQYLQTFVYIARNPVKAGLVCNAVDYRFSSFTDIIKRFHRRIDPLPVSFLKQAWIQINH